MNKSTLVHKHEQLCASEKSTFLGIRRCGKSDCVGVGVLSGVGCGLLCAMSVCECAVVARLASLIYVHKVAH